MVIRCRVGHATVAVIAPERGDAGPRALDDRVVVDVYVHNALDGLVRSVLLVYLNAARGPRHNVLEHLRIRRARDVDGGPSARCVPHGVAEDTCAD